MSRSSRPLPKPNFGFWTLKDKLWYANRQELVDAIAKSGKNEQQIRDKMRNAQRRLDDALAGVGLDIWGVLMVESPLLPDQPMFLGVQMGEWKNKIDPVTGQELCRHELLPEKCVNCSWLRREELGLVRKQKGNV